MQAESGSFLWQTPSRTLRRNGTAGCRQQDESLAATPTGNFSLRRPLDGSDRPDASFTEPPDLPDQTAAPDLLTDTADSSFGGHREKNLPEFSQLIKLGHLIKFIGFANSDSDPVSRA